MWWPIDIVLAFVLTGLLCRFLYRTGKVLFAYFAIPIALLWAHVVGSLMQDLHVGPAWVQHHFHNVGVPGWSMIGVAAVLFRYTRGAGPRTKYTVANFTMLLVPVGWLATSLAAIGYEIVWVTVFHESAIREGYSGEVDFGDFTAYAVSLLLIGLNLLLARPPVLRRLCPKILAMQV